MAEKFVVDFGWQVFLKDLGVDPEDLLRHARLPVDLFFHEVPRISADECCRLWASFDALVEHPNPALAMGQAATVEVFSPPLFAAYCSPNLLIALQRLARYKPLIGPMTLEVSDGPEGVSLSFGPLPGRPLPKSMALFEVVFLTNLARTALREDIRPTRVEQIYPPDTGAYADFLGTEIVQGHRNMIRFSHADSRKPFLTVNPTMFSIFEPELQARLRLLESSGSFSERVRRCLVGNLAAGRTGMGDVADQLAVSTRTLQRRLRDEDTSFQQVLADVRSELAQSYLRQPHLSSAEISFLLGYDDPNSFIRAFHGWTGTSPEAARAQLN